MVIAVVVLSLLLAGHIALDVYVWLNIRQSERQHKQENVLFDRMQVCQLAQQKMLSAGKAAGTEWDALELEIADILREHLEIEDDEFYRNWYNEIVTRFAKTPGLRH